MNFPHHYRVTASARTDGPVLLTADNLPGLESDAPAQFGGPGNRWSPEDLLTAAVADCFVLSFRAIAAASKFPFNQLEVNVEGTLDRVERAMLFTSFQIRASLNVAAGNDAERARRLLEKAEQACLITNSLKSAVHLECEIVEGA
jgi:peroxiredoxin-like protein